MSVLFTGSFGLLSYLSVRKDALIFEELVSVCATAGCWFGQVCVFHSLDLLCFEIERPGHYQ